MPSHRETAISAIETVLHPSSSAELRMQATQWLEGVVASDDGWGLLMSLLAEKTPDVRMKAAILVKNKIKKTSDRLDERAANSMAGAIYEKLIEEGTSPSSCAQVIINHLIVSLVLVLARVPESSKGLIPRIASHLSNSPSSLTMILRVLADEITVLKQAIPSHASESQQHEVFGPIFALGKSLKSASQETVSLIEKHVLQKRITLLEGLKWFSAWIPYLEIEVSATSKFMSCIFEYNKDMLPGEKETILDSLKALSRKCSSSVHPEVVNKILELTTKIARLLEPEAVVSCALIASNYTTLLVQQVIETQQPGFLVTFLSTYASECLSQKDKCENGDFLANITPFWTGIRTAVRRINEDSRELVTPILTQPVMSLLRSTLKYFEIDDSHRGEDEDVNLECLLRDIAVIIKPGVFMSTVLHEIFQGNLSWKPLESRIASLSAISTVVGYETWEDHSQALCSMLPSVSSPDCHPTIRIAYCSVLHRVSFAFAANPEQLRSAVELLLSTKSFKSLSRVCLSLGKEMASDPQILKIMTEAWTNLPQIVTSSEGSSTRDAEVLSDSLWQVLCKTPSDAMTAHVSSLLQPVTVGIDSAFSSGDQGKASFTLEKLQFLIKKSKTWRSLQPAAGDSHRENVRAMWTGFFEPILGVVFPCLDRSLPNEIINASAGCVAGMALVSNSNLQQWQPVLERLTAIVSNGYPQPELYSVITEIIRPFCHDDEACKALIGYLGAFLTSAGKHLTQVGDPSFSDVPLAKAVFRMLSEVLKRNVIIDSKSRRSSLAIALVNQLGAPIVELTCQAMKSSVVVEPELVRYVLSTCEALLLIPTRACALVKDCGPQLTAAAIIATTHKPSEALAQLTKILNTLKKFGGDLFQPWIAQAFASANLGLQSGVIQQFTTTITQNIQPSTKPAVEGLFKAVHSQCV